MKKSILRKGPGSLEGQNLSLFCREVLLLLVSPDPELARRLLGVFDPGRLSELRSLWLTPILYWQLMQLGWEGSISPKSLDWLQRDYARALRETLGQEQESCQIIQSLLAAGVEVTLLKGADLRQRLYGEAAVRPAVDLDLLVSPEHLPKAEAALVGLGYRLSPRYYDPRRGYHRQFGHALEYTSTLDRLPVDLHWQILAVSDFYRLPYHSLRSRAVPWDYQGLPLLLLAPEHLLIHLCLRFYNDKFSFFFLLDLALALSRLHLDWHLFLQETSRFQCQRPVYLILRNLPRLFPLKVPPWVLAELRSYRPGWYERIALSSRLRFLTLNLPMLYHHYPVRAWPAYYLGKIWPTDEFLAAIYGKPDRLTYLRQLLNVLSD